MRVAASRFLGGEDGHGTDIGLGESRGAMLVERGSGGRVWTPECSAAAGADELGTINPWSGGA